MSTSITALPDGPEDGLRRVERRRAQLWGIAIVVMAGLAASTVLLALALEGTGPAAPLPSAVRVGLVPLVVVVSLYLLEKERHLRSVTRTALQAVSGARSTAVSPTGQEWLTGLLTASAFRDRLVAALDDSRRTGEPVAVVVLDVDRATAAIARHGHDVADGVLVEVARRLRGVARTDDILGRTGADELALLAEGVPATDAAASLAHRLVDAVQAPLVVDGHELQVPVTVGVVVQRGGRRDGADDVLRDARLARHLARRRPGRPWEVFDRLGPPESTVPQP